MIDVFRGMSALLAAGALAIAAATPAMADNYRNRDRESIGAGEGFRRTFWRALREARGLTAITGEAGQFPAHGAIA